MTNKNTDQKHGIPALINVFIPGLGQMMKQEIGKGICIFIGIVLLSVTIIGIPIAFIVWVWAIIDAYNKQ